MASRLSLLPSGQVLGMCGKSDDLWHWVRRRWSDTCAHTSSSLALCLIERVGAFSGGPIAAACQIKSKERRVLSKDYNTAPVTSPFVLVLGEENHLKSSRDWLFHPSLLLGLGFMKPKTNQWPLWLGLDRSGPFEMESKLSGTFITDMNITAGLRRWEKLC